MKLEFSWQIFEKYPISNFMKIFPVVAKFHADKSHESDSCFFFAILWIHSKILGFQEQRKFCSSANWTDT